jgi:tetratricopeptide (TPR) repeat protein
MSNSDPTDRSLGKRLDTWKEIGAFFGRDERTVKRWETTRGLPIHRVPGAGRANVYAYTQELTEWLQGAGNKSEEAAPADSAEEESAAGQSEEPQVASSNGADGGDAGASNASSASSSTRATGARLVALMLLAVLVAGTGLFLAWHYWSSARGNTLNSEAAARKPDPTAEDLYLKGIYYWHRRTPESLNQAVDYFTQAIVRDPSYAQAYVGLANCYNLLREYSSMKEEEAYPRAKAAAERAIALDDRLSAAHSSLAFVDMYWTWDFEAAEREFRRAIELDPGSVPAHHWYATALMAMGRRNEALAEIDQAQKLDPQSASILADRALILFVGGQKQQGVQRLQELEQSDPAFLSPHRYLKEIYLSRGDDKNFLAEAKTVADAMHDDVQEKLVVAGQKGLAESGHKGLLSALLQERKRLYEAGEGSAYEVARAHARLGENREALNYLQLSYKRHEPIIVGMETEELFEPLHNDPEYLKILHDVGFRN